ncbi:MAG: GTP-binding protein, partial [Opitutales bacterium]|nr:GTP-binding protein [Opitutales bacterium]
MISSRIAKSLEAARRQLGGELSKRGNKMCDTLVEALARTEAYIDFSDEDLPPQSLDFSKSLLEKFCAEAERLASTSRYGAVLRDGFNVSIIGEPNAGKSSLLNGLLGRRRAIVSDVAGTTRDFIAERIELDGWIVNLTDTAGIRNSSDDIEREGISSALSLAKDADLKLLVVDVSRPNPEIFDLAKDCLDSKNTILVLNKIDLPRCKGLPLPRGFKTVEISCLKETGLEDLKRVVSEFIRENSINSSFDDILVSARHMELVDSAIRAAREAAEKISRAQPMELIASDIRAALDSVGEIVGRLDREEVLDKIFSTFCVGK